MYICKKFFYFCDQLLCIKIESCLTRKVFMQALNLNCFVCVCQILDKLRDLVPDVDLFDEFYKCKNNLIIVIIFVICGHCILVISVAVLVNRWSFYATFDCLVVIIVVIILFLLSFFPAHQAHEAFEGVRPRPTKPPGFPSGRD